MDFWWFIGKFEEDPPRLLRMEQSLPWIRRAQCPRTKDLQGTNSPCRPRSQEPCNSEYRSSWKSFSFHSIFYRFLDRSISGSRRSKPSHFQVWDPYKSEISHACTRGYVRAEQHKRQFVRQSAGRLVESRRIAQCRWWVQSRSRHSFSPCMIWWTPWWREKRLAKVPVSRSQDASIA